MKKLSFAILLLAATLSSQSQKLYSLDQLLQDVEHCSSGAAIDEAQITGAEADLFRARSSYFPKVSATSGWVSIHRPLQLFDATASISDIFGPVAPFVNQIVGDKLNNMATLDLRNIWFANVSAMQPLFTGGEVVASNKMAELALKLRREQGVRSAEERRYAVKEAYYLLVGLYEQKALLELYQSMLDSVVSDVEALYKEGYATKSALLEAKLAKSKAKRGRAELNGMLPVATRNLVIVAGLPDDIEIAPAETIETLGKSAAEHLDLSSMTREGNPSLSTALPDDARNKILALTSEIAKCESAIAQSKMLPKLALFANYSVFYPNFFNAMEKKVGGTFSFGVILQVPISDIYSGYQAKKSATQKALITQLEAKEKGRKIALEQTKYLNEAKTAASNYLFYLEQSQEATANLALASEGYKEGVVEIEKFLRTQADWLQTKIDYIQSVVALYTKQAAYYLSTI